MFGALKGDIGTEENSYIRVEGARGGTCARLGNIALRTDDFHTWKSLWIKNISLLSVSTPHTTATYRINETPPANFKSTSFEVGASNGVA